MQSPRRHPQSPRRLWHAACDASALVLPVLQVKHHLHPYRVLILKDVIMT